MSELRQAGAGGLETSLCSGGVSRISSLVRHRGGGGGYYASTGIRVVAVGRCRHGDGSALRGGGLSVQDGAEAPEAGVGPHRLHGTDVVRGRLGPPAPPPPQVGQGGEAQLLQLQ